MPYISNQKISPSLALSLNATESELKKSASLSFGYNFQTDLWEIIVRYFGSLEAILSDYPNLSFYELLGGYGILYASKSLLEEIATLPGIIYMEKPNALYYEDYEGNRASCITQVQANSTLFTGKDVLVAIIDSGIDYTHPDFRFANGRTRIVSLWDQTLDEIYSSDQINLALSKNSDSERSSICPSVDISGHGTHVAGIAAGNGFASSGLFRGVAYEASLLIVKLGYPTANSFPSTTQLMRAIDFCIREGIRLQSPLAINISFGNTYGSHSGTSLLETYINYVTNLSRCSICIGSGNEGDSDGHTSGRFINNRPQTIEFSVSDYSPTLNIQLWKRYEDVFTISIQSPVSSPIAIPSEAENFRLSIGQTNLFIHYGMPAPYSSFQEIYIQFIPQNSYIDTGIWSITLSPQSIRLGDYEMWMPSSAARNSGTRFLSPTVSTTLTIPASAHNAITVGAYDSITDQPASFSGRGYTWGTNQTKPDLVAPGIAITSCAPGGGYTQRSGTSMATPFVTGSCACLMQWGILEGNDTFLYGEKLKAYLRKGARTLPAFSSYPNAQVGWGALCLRSSLPL